MKDIQRARYSGFTLLEILIALLVFAILSTITATAMRQAFETRERVAIQTDRLGQLQLAIAIIKRDTQQIIDRSVLGNDRHIFPPIVGLSSYFEFTRGGLENPLFLARRSNLQRVAFRCKEGQLIRRHWLQVDSPSRSQYAEKVLLDHVSNCKFSYVAHNQQMLSTWQSYALQQDQRQEILPMAVQLKFDFDNWGNLSQFFILPGGLYDGQI